MTLARDYLEHGRVLHRGNEMCEATHEMLIKCLEPIRDSDNPEQRVRSYAEQFVFDECPADVIGALVDNGSLDPRVVIETARLPNDVCWLEWSVNLYDDPKCRVGVLLANRLARLVNKENKRTIAAAFVMRAGENVACFGLLSFPHLPLRIDTDQIGVGFWKDVLDIRSTKEGDERWNDIKYFAWDVLDALFLVMTPRVCEVRVAEHSPRLQRNRERRGKLPLVEYKKMLLRIGVGKPRYVKHAGDPAELVPGAPTGRHHRLHSVIGHFRTYRRGRDVPFATFVPQHWRGDPQLGVVLRERHVRKD